MKKNKRKIIAAVVALLCFSAFSQQNETFTETRTLTLDEAVSLAKENNISIKTAQGSLDLLKAKNNYSWNSVSPTLKVAGSFVDNFDTQATSLGITGSVSMGLSTNLISSIQGAKIAYDQGQLSYEQTCRKIELTVRKAFYALIYSEENLKAQKRALETAKAQYESNKEKFRNGQISELDVMQSRVNYEQKIPTVENATLLLSNDYRTFKQTLGLDQKLLIKLAGTLDDVMKIKAVAMPKELDEAPDVISAQFDLDTEKNKLLANRFSAYGPVITASYNYGKTKLSSSETWGTKNDLTLGVSIPLDGYLPWSNGAAAISASKISVKNAEMKLENTKTTVLINTENYVRKINQGISQLKSLKSTADLSEQTYQMTKTAYNYGKTDLMSLQKAQDNVLSSEVSVKSQAYTLLGTIFDLEYLLGLPFGSFGE